MLLQYWQWSIKKLHDRYRKKQCNFGQLKEQKLLIIWLYLAQYPTRIRLCGHTHGDKVCLRLL